MEKTTIKPQDLRIGNWVLMKENANAYAKIHPDKRYAKVNGVDKEDVFVSLPQTGPQLFPLYYNEIEPIPLTDKLLYDSGFKYSETDGKWTDGFDIMDVITSGDCYEGTPYITVNGDTVRPSVHCRYLHELQNLYWAVAGEEIGINAEDLE